MESVFKSFCAFGSRKDETVDLMDNAKFSKLARDLKILDKKLTSTDVDIIFNKVKSKTERKITYHQFEDGVKLMAEKKYPGDAEGYNKLKDLINSGSGPTASGVTKTAKSDTVERLTDTSKYTGSHKERFDESGKGKGLDGRREFDEKASAGYVGGYKEMNTYDQNHK
ncbi:tubulin polymerization-promoting protein family member 2 [Hydra vulgaris]|uniref:tubulin polymerization-promoting protein family member 2 n=1 Tax=Hydra vulgaris TaxID=6087 RepID=UPI001F5EBFF5|nr:tubulin polymerization-promoting protein family member 2-like [Hydra vulgaris]